MTSTQSNNTILPVGKAAALIMALTPPGLAVWPTTSMPLALKTLDEGDEDRDEDGDDEEGDDNGDDEGGDDDDYQDGHHHHHDDAMCMANATARQRGGGGDGGGHGEMTTMRGWC